MAAPAGSKASHTGRNIFLGSLGFLIVTLWKPWFGIVVGGGAMAWSGYAIKTRRASLLGLFYPSANVTLLGVLSFGLAAFIFGIGTYTLIDQIQIEQRAQQRVATLRSDAPKASNQWAAKISEAETSLSGAKTEDINRSVQVARGASGTLKAARETVAPYLALSPVPAEFVLVEKKAAALESRVAAMVALLEAVASLPSAKADISTRIKNSDWLAADEALKAGRAQLTLIESTTADAKSYVPSSFDIAETRKELDRFEAKIKPKADKVRRDAAAQEAALVAVKAVCGENPCEAGICIGLERAIKKTAHDPDSIDVVRCTPAELTSKKCWITTCDVRGKNAFGALILTRKRYARSSSGWSEAK